MGLNTNNAGALVGKAENAVTDLAHKVEVLISTFVKSLGRDVRVGETVEVSHDDYRFLKPYRYVKDAEVEADEAEGSDETTEDTGKTGDEGNKTDEGASGGKVSTTNPPKVEGKRKQ